MQYMGLMVDLSDILVENDNGVIPDTAQHMFHLIGTRLDRLERASVTLRERVMQLQISDIYLCVSTCYCSDNLVLQKKKYL